MVTEITGLVFKDMIINASNAISIEKQTINDLNVFPVPDGDTGTNMSLTIGAAVNELNKRDPKTISETADVAASSLLRGARGNSGVILSLLFRGIAKSLKGVEAADAKTFAAALQSGVSSAYNAVMKPTEGTILTVSRMSAEAAVSAAEAVEDVEELLEISLEAAKAALANTINQNPVLKKAGVIDAGGKGYVCILEGMLKALRGEMLTSSDGSVQPSDKADFAGFSDEDITYTYCTEFIVSRENHKNPDVLRDYLSTIGDSIVMVVDDDIIKVHVHNDIPGKVLTEALTYGPLITIKIENMREQHSAKIIDSGEAAVPSNIKAKPEKKYGVVSVCAGDGLVETFKELGVDGVVTGGQTMNPSTEDILDQVDRTPAEIVFVLPNNKNIIMAAEQCIPLSDKKVIVIPTTTVMQGISAMMNFDVALDEEALTESMSSAFSNVHTASITYAARDSDYDGQDIKMGQFLAMLENSLLAHTSDFDFVADTIISSVSEFSPDLITIFYGEQVLEEDADELADCFRAALPDADITVAYGGQPVYFYFISAE